MSLTGGNRVIYKQGYLKKAPTPGFGASFRKWERKWFMFGTMTGSAFLEYYDTEAVGAQQAPLNSIIWLGSCQFVTVNMMEQRYDNVFTIGMIDRILNLVAPTIGEMTAWVTCLKNNLTRLGILQGTENVYDEHPNNSSSEPSSFCRVQCSTNENDMCSAVDTNKNKNGLQVSIPPLNGESVSSTTKKSSICESKFNLERVYPNASSPGLAVLEYELNTRPMQVLVEYDVDETGKKVPLRDPRSPLPPTPTLSQTGSSSTVSSGYFNLSSPPQSSDVPCTPPVGNLIDFDMYEHPLPSPESKLPNLTNNMHDIENDTYGAVWRQHTESIPNIFPLVPPRTGLTPLQRQNSRPIKVVDRQEPEAPILPLRKYSYPSSELSSPRSPEPCLFGLNNSGRYDESPTSPKFPVDPSFDPLPAASTFDPEAMKNVMACSIGANRVINQDMILDLVKNTPTAPKTIQRQNSRGALTEKMGSMTLKEREVYQLRQEISHPGGVKVSLRKKDCNQTLALVEVQNVVWIAGWNQKARPFLHSAFHIGDQIVSVNGFQVTCVKDVPRVLDSSRDDVKVEFIVKRTPYAKVFAIKRSAEGESLGFTRERRTAEIAFVNLDGLAAKHGLPANAQTLDGRNLCNWIITEVNNRPLNLFFKDNEIGYRLNAVGKDISIMVQPLDFVKLLKKQLKQLRNYKDFIVQ